MEKVAVAKSHLLCYDWYILEISHMERMQTCIGDKIKYIKILCGILARKSGKILYKI